MDTRANRKTRVIGCVAMLLYLTAASAFGQGAQSATVTGTVVDNVGVVPGATVTTVNAATGETRTGVTNAQGVFRLVSLPPGQYQLKVNMTGFKQIDMTLPLLAGEVRDLQKLTLAAGGVTETVNVTAEATPVQTASSALQKSLSGDLLTSVQVKGRDIFGMLKILPGVADSKASRDFTYWDSGRYLSINGGNSLYKNTTIDGVPVGEEGGNGTTHITPNIDSIAEVNVITSGYTAENGRMASGQLVMVTKSGTNQLKGSTWYNGRRDWMNKNDYFRIKQGAEKPFFAVDMYGYSIGGPVVIPGVINSRSSQKKVFFFASQEFIKDIRPTTISRTNLPTARERAGDFSQTYICSNPCSATRNADGTIASMGNARLLALTNPFGSAAPDFFIAPNVINPKYFNAMGRAMMNLLPLPNEKYNPAFGQAFSSNDAQDATPIHDRKDTVLRVDTVLSQNTRFSIRGLFDRDDNTSPNNIMPGVGTSDNVFPGNLITASVTKVIRPTVVNELTVGFSQNHWGFKRKPGPLDPADYTSWYRQNVGLDPPRLAPFGPYRDPPVMDNNNEDQYPYLPYMLFAGGSYPNYGYVRAAGSSGPLPRWNQNYRYTLSDDLSIVRGRHSLKFGFSTELNSKTEPGSQDYVGSYNFGHSANNPLSTGNGYANALIGVFTSYSERDRRIDYDIAHWLTEGYLQDTWRATPRFTIDYGLRITHNGSLYDRRGFNSAFDPALWKRNEAPVLFRPYCRTGAAGDRPCSTSNRAAINPLTGEIVSQAFAGTIVPGSGKLANGQFTGGLPGKRPGEYDSLVPVSWGPRVGFAWDVSGNGKTAIRGAAGVFYNLFTRSFYGFQGGPLISSVRQVLNAQMGDIGTLRDAGNLALTPQNTKIPFGFPMTLYGNQIAPGELETSRHYQANFAVQRDIGFNTTVEVAWVGNFNRHEWQQKSTNNVPLFAYAKPENLFNNEPIAANFIRRDYPGVGAINYGTTDYVGLNYNSLQVSLQRRLSHGLQFGLAYTLAKGEGMRGWDFATEELYGMEGLRKLYYGPQTSGATGQERRHVTVFNYSYQIPTLDKPVLRWILAGWEASGVTTIVTGDAINPTCGNNRSGVQYTDPTLSGARNNPCEYVPGQNLFSGYDPNPTGSAPIEEQLHFNVGALRRPLPDMVNGIGNLGNVGFAVLRNPGWSNWDFTLARRLPIKVGRGGNARIQLQFYNLFNQIEFNQMGAAYTFGANGNSNNSTGKYTSTQNPFNFGMTIRFDY